MSKPSPTSPTRIWVDKHELSVHPRVAETPKDRSLIDMLVEDWRAKLAAGVKPEKLIRETAKINKDKEIGDARHRWEAALCIDEIKFIECEVLDDDAFETLIVEMLMQRRHYSKSALSYALRHMAAKAAQAGRESRTANASASRGIDVSRSNRLTSESNSGTLASLALKSGLSVDILQQAVKLETQYMAKADKLIADWLELNAEEAELWQSFQDANPTIEMPWSAFRSQRLSALGVKDDAASIHTIPRHWREIEEDKIFNGIVEKDGEDDDRRSYSLGSALKAMGSYFATAGEKRNDLNPGNPALYLTLKAKVGSFSTTMWKQWGTLDPAGRMEVIKELSAKVVEWPEDVRRAMSVALSGKGVAA